MFVDAIRYPFVNNRWNLFIILSLDIVVFCLYFIFNLKLSWYYDLDSQKHRKPEKKKNKKNSYVDQKGLSINITLTNDEDVILQIIFYLIMKILEMKYACWSS